MKIDIIEKLLSIQIILILNNSTDGFSFSWFILQMKCRERTNLSRLLVDELLNYWLFSVCNFVCHDRCLKTVVSYCSGVALQLIKVGCLPFFVI